MNERTTCPDIRDIVPPDDAVDPVGLRLAVYRYTVHTESPAKIGNDGQC